MGLPAAARRGLATMAAGLALVAALARPAPAASVPPEQNYRTLRLSRVTVHYPEELEGLARRSGSLAEEILARHEARYGHRVGRVHLVIRDDVDYSNGYATPLPYPVVQVNAFPPTGGDELGNDEDWGRMVLTHELAHIIHLDWSRGLPGFGRNLLGRAPFLFPNLASPTWLVEGLATYEETTGTAFGRGRSPITRMVLRAAAVGGDWPGEDRAITDLDRWPGGQAAYLFGEQFLADLTARYGEAVLPEITRRNAGHIIPFLDDVAAHKVTGRTFHGLWAEWSARARTELEAEAAGIRARGLTPARALTRRGIRQTAPRFSPDGSRIAYTSRTLTTARGLRLVDADGAHDRWLTRRLGGQVTAWTPDGQSLVYDEPERWHTFFTRSDLRQLDVRSPHPRWLTRGLRAREPDVSPDGSAVVFARDLGEGSELFVLPLSGPDGVARRPAGPADPRLRPLTRSDPRTRWSTPRFSPDGREVAAARWRPGGWLDVVVVDLATGGLTELTRDRAVDAEPAWLPDGQGIVFRSDRDGVPNLYLWRARDGALLRVTRVLGGAFTPAVSPTGDAVAWADYSARGYDLSVARLDPAALEPAAPFVDPYGGERLEPAPATVAPRGESPWPTALPRFWSPYAETTGGEWRLGALTGGSDPLFRHAWVLAADRGLETGTNGVEGAYRYDRFRPTLTVSAKDRHKALDADTGALEHEREVVVQAVLPLRLTVRSVQSLSLAYRRGQEEQTGPGGPARLDLGGLELSWGFGNLQRHPYSISPVDGVAARVSALREARGLGSSVDLTKAVADLRAYLRLGGNGVLAIRGTGGATFGEPEFLRSFTLGGFPDGVLRDVSGDNHGVLRGYPDDVFSGRRFVNGSVEVRVPLAHPQAGWRLFPLFVRHLHATAFADAGEAFSGEFQLGEVAAGAGAALGADTVIFNGVPLTATLSVARGFADRGETRVDFRMGLSF